MTRKRLLLAAGGLLLISLWCAAHWYINQLFEERFGLEDDILYQIGDTVQLGDNIVYDLPAEGYAICVDSAQLLSMEEFAEQYGERTLTNAPDRVLAVEMTVTNIDSDADGVYLPDFQLHTVNSYTDLNYEMTVQANPVLQDGVYGITVPEGESYTVYLIYNLRKSNLTAHFWETMTEKDFYLRVTESPVKQEVVLG